MGQVHRALLVVMAGCAPDAESGGGGGRVPDPVVHPPEVEIAAPSCTAAYTWDALADGVPEGAGTDTFDLATHLPLQSERDWDLDGGPDRVEDWLRNGNGDVVAYLLDEDGSGTASHTIVSTWDDAGQLLREETDDDADGDLDRIETWAWNADGTLAAWDVDRDADGVPEQATVYAYLDGLRVGEQLDNDADGAPEVFGTRTYDAAGRQVLYVSDRFGDGSIELVETTVYDDETGPSGTVTVDADADDTIDSVKVQRYADGHLVYERFDTSPADGIPDYENTLAWADDRIVAEDGTQDLGAGVGVVTFAIRRTWAQGDLLAEQVVTVTGGDGVLATTRETWEIACP